MSKARIKGRRRRGVTALWSHCPRENVFSDCLKRLPDKSDCLRCDDRFFQRMIFCVVSPFLYVKTDSIALCHAVSDGHSVEPSCRPVRHSRLMLIDAVS